MSETLYHHGVKGMRWGVRKERKAMKFDAKAAKYRAKGNDHRVKYYEKRAKDTREMTPEKEKKIRKTQAKRLAKAGAIMIGISLAGIGAMAITDLADGQNSTIRKAGRRAMEEAARKNGATYVEWLN